MRHFEALLAYSKKKYPSSEEVYVIGNKITYVDLEVPTSRISLLNF